MLSFCLVYEGNKRDPNINHMHIIWIPHQLKTNQILESITSTIDANQFGTFHAQHVIVGCVLVVAE